MMDEAPKRFIENKERQQKLRKRHAEKYGSIEAGQIGLLKDYDVDPHLAEEVREKRPVMVMAVCEAGEHRSKLVAEALQSEGMGYVASYAGVVEGMSYPLSKQKLEEDQPEVIIFSTRGEKGNFIERFPEYYRNRVKSGEVLLRVIGLSESEVARRLHRDDQARETKEAKRLRAVIKDRLIEMGFEPLGNSWS